jgi:hypothetical protein
MPLDPDVPAPKNPANWLWIIGLVGALVVLGVVVSGGSGSTAPAASPPPSPTAVPKAGLETPPPLAAPPAPVHIVVYEVTGTGTGTVTFGVDGVGGTEVATEVALPWTTIVELPVDATPRSVSVVADAGPGTVEIGARITVDGQVLSEGTSNSTYLAVSLNANVGAPA